MMETQKVTKVYLSLSKAQAIKLRDTFDSSSFNGFEELAISLAIGAVGLIVPATGVFMYVAGGVIGGALVMPTRQENMGRDIGKIVDLMDNDEHVIVEFAEELTYATMNDYLNNKVSKRELLYVSDHTSTGTNHISPRNIGAYLGI